MKRIDEDLFARIRDRVAIVGIGHLPFAKDIGRPISDTAIEAIQMAIDDAGLEAEDVDGMSMFEMEHTHEVTIARRLGVKNLQWWDKISYGGGASVRDHHARRGGDRDRARRRSSSATARATAARRRRGPWAQERELVTDDKALHVPWGLIRPVDVIGMWAHRHMHEYGTTREQLGNVAIAARKHANRNPYAMMHGRPLDMKTYLARARHRLSADALRLLPGDRRGARLRRDLGRARARSAAEAGAGALGRAGERAESRCTSPTTTRPTCRRRRCRAPSSSGGARSCSRRTWTARRSTTPSRRW